MLENVEFPITIGSGLLKPDPASVKAMPKILKKGTYVLASQFSDADIKDPWMIGPITEAVTTENGKIYYRVNGRLFKHVIKIKPKMGEYILKNADSLSGAHRYFSLRLLVELIQDYNKFSRSKNG